MGNQKFQPSPTRIGPRVFYGYIVVGAAFFIMLIMFGIFSTFGVFFKPMLGDLGWTRALTSGAVALNWLLQGLVGIIAGKVSDKLGPRLVITVCGCIFGLGYLLMSQIGTLWQLYLFYSVLVGMGISSAFVPLASTIARWFVARRGMMTGIVAAGVGIGSLVSPPVANWLISAYSWRTSYVILGAIAFVAVALVAQFLRRDPAQVGQTPYGENNNEEAGFKEGVRAFSLKEAASTGQFWLAFSIFLSLGFCMYTIFVHIVPHATDLGLSAAIAANILAAAGGAGVVGRIVFGSVADRIGNRQVFTISFVFIAAALCGLALATEAWTLYLFAAIFGAAASGCAILQPTLLAELFGLRSHGLILGVTSLGYCIGAGAGPLIAGYIFDVSSSYYWAFLLCAAISLVGLILTTLLAPTKTN